MPRSRPVNERNFGARKVFGYSVKATFRFQLMVVTLAAIAAAWFWALSPILTPLFYLTPTNWTDADLVRHLWHLRLIQPEWVGSPPQYDYIRWAQMETLARLGVVFLGWLGGVACATRRYLLRRRQPNETAALVVGSPVPFQ
jgi:hypothetical protein